MNTIPAKIITDASLKLIPHAGLLPVHTETSRTYTRRRFDSTHGLLLSLFSALSLPFLSFFSSFLSPLFLFLFLFLFSCSCSCSCSFSFSSFFPSHQQTLYKEPTNMASNFEAFECDVANGRFIATANELHGMFPPSSSLLPPPSLPHPEKKRGDFLLQEYFRRGIYFLIQFSINSQKSPPGKITVVTVLY